MNEACPLLVHDYDRRILGATQQNLHKWWYDTMTIRRPPLPSLLHYPSLNTFFMRRLLWYEYTNGPLIRKSPTRNSAWDFRGKQEIREPLHWSCYGTHSFIKIRNLSWASIPVSCSRVGTTDCSLPALSWKKRAPQETQPETSRKIRHAGAVVLKLVREHTLS